MSVELQIRSSALGSITAKAVELQLRTTCFARLGPIYVDHADVVDAPVEVFPANGTVRLRVPIDIFAVQRAAVLAAPNAIPAGATTAAGNVVLVLEMSVAVTVLSLKCIDADLGALAAALGAAAPAAKVAIIAAAGSPVSSNLGPALKQLGMRNPRASRIELIGDTVAIRFEPMSPAADHLFPGQDWGLFLDGAAVEELAKSKTPNAMSEKLSSFVLNAHWAPVGTSPRVNLDFSGKAQMPYPLAGDADGKFACDFAIIGLGSRTLRTMVHWSLHIDGGPLVPAFIEKAVRELIEVDVFFSVLKNGGVPAGDHAFALDSVLRDVSFSGARFNYSSILASPAGMTLGGSVRWPILPSREILKSSLTKFGLPYRLEFCSVLAESGSGAPNRSATIDELTTTGRVWLEDGGAFCDLEIVSPGDWITQYVSAPGAGGAAESGEIRIVIPSAVALGITQAVQLIVRTSRGVRLLDLGTPPTAIIDANGNVTNAQLAYIDDCLYLPVGPDDGIHGINWGDPRNVLVNPVDWFDYTSSLQGLDVQLVSFFGLAPGELLQFRSRDHRVDVTADLSGQATVPVLLPLADQTGSAILTRVNRQSIEGHFTVDSVVFQRQASLPAGLRSSLVSGMNGTARLTTEFEDRVAVHEIGTLGALTQIANQQISDSGGRLSTSGELLSGSRDVSYSKRTPSQSRHRCDDLHGVAALYQVPGFGDAPVAIAEMKDGSKLVLDLKKEGARVAGTFTGPIGAVDIADDWGLIAGRDQATVYRVRRSQQPGATTRSTERRAIESELDDI